MAAEGWAGGEMAMRRAPAAATTAALACLLQLLSAGTALAADDTSPPAAFDFVADAGIYQSGFHVASPYNNFQVTWQPTTDDISPVTYEVAVDGDVVRVVTGEDGGGDITRRVEVAEGTHIVTVAAVDAAGNRTYGTHGLDVVVDKVDPWFTSQPHLQLWPGPVTRAGFPMRYTWTGDDVGTGLVSARIGPGVACCFTVPASLTHYDFMVPARSEMVWRLRLVDGVGREARVPRSGYVSPARWDDTHRSSGWRRADSGGALGGSEFVTSRRGSSLSFTSTGKSVGWVASTGPRRGRADVYIGGTRVDRVNLYSVARQPAQVVWSAPLSKSKPQKVTIVNRSGPDRPTITVDALLVHR
jgi:hypothetical protein